MKKEDIEHLARLSRIDLTESEKEAFASEVTDILAYVSAVEAATGDAKVVKEAGPLHTVMRDDGEPHESGIYTEALLSAAPERDGAYVKVKKIIADKS